MKRALWIDAVLVFVLSAVYLRLLPDCFNVFDEGILADGADRVFRGQMLHRDIWNYWNPGSFWLYGGLFHLFGASVATLRIPLALMGAAAAVGVWRLARDHCGRGLALLAGLAAPGVCYPVFYMASPHWNSTFAAIAAMLALRSCVAERATPGACLTTGLLCGLAFVMLQPVGVAVSLAVGLALLWDRAWTASAAELLRTSALTSLGALVPIGAMYGYFAAHGLLGPMFYDTIVFNLVQYGPSYDVPYGAGSAVGDAALQATGGVLMLLPIGYGAALTLAGARYLGRSAGRRDRRLFVLALGCCGMLGSNYYFLDVAHLAFAAPPGFAVSAALLGRLRAAPRPWLAHAGTALLAFAVLGAGAASLHRLRSGCAGEIVTPRGEVAVPENVVEHYESVFGFLEQELGPGDEFYVYPYGSGYNFLADRPNPTPYAGVFPNVPTLTTELQLADVAAHLGAKRVRFVLVPIVGVIYTGGLDEGLDTPLERHIRAHYRTTAHLVHARVWERWR